MKISVIGTGYVGLVGGVCLADAGNQVICMDNDPTKIESLEKGKVTIWEPGLEELLLKNIKNQNLSFTNDLEFAIKNSEIIFFCLPTPPMEDGSADLKYVLDVASKIGEYFDDYKLIVNKSTVPVGTTEKIREVLSQNAKSDFDVVSNPEFLREGKAVWDFMNPDRIVVGTGYPKAKEKMYELYKDFVDSPEKIVFMDEKSSEITKYASNSFLATKISFINEVANVCDLVGADVEKVAVGMGLDPRIGSQFLKAGIGYGGSCFPKDVKALLNSSKSLGYYFKILDTVEKVNADQKKVFLNKVLNYFGNSLKGKKFAVWGLAFKGDTDDIRESPALDILPLLIENGARISAFDPVAIDQVKKYYDFDIDYNQDIYEVLEDAEALLILTEWKDFGEADWSKVFDKMKNKIIFDGKNILDRKQMEDLGFRYFGMGK